MVFISQWDLLSHVGNGLLLNFHTKCYNVSLRSKRLLAFYSSPVQPSLFQYRFQAFIVGGRRRPELLRTTLPRVEDTERAHLIACDDGAIDLHSSPVPSASRHRCSCSTYPDSNLVRLSDIARRGRGWKSRVVQRTTKKISFYICLIILLHVKVYISTRKCRNTKGHMYPDYGHLDAF